ALRRPDPDRALVLIGANYHFNGNMPTEPGGSGPKGLRDRYAARSPDGGEHFATFLAKSQAMWTSEPTLTTDDLRKVSAPTLVIAGDDDLLTLAHLLRRAGVHVNAERARVYLQAIAAIDLERPEDVRAASRTALVSRQADLAPFEITFDLFWSLLRGGRLTAPVPSARRPKAESDQIEVP